jgi:hypothetical protein
MSTLTGNQIKNTYQGLLKLADSSTGITSNYQQVQDGLGNNTNSRISTSGFISPNIMNITSGGMDFGGLGASNTDMSYATDEYDSLVMFPFIDNGYNSYSAITTFLRTATTTSDVVEIGFYTSQLNDNYGLVPYQLIMTGGTLTTTGSTGTKTLVLPSTLSFSGYGQGVYFAAIRTRNAGSTPSVRFRSNVKQANLPSYLSNQIGFYGITAFPNPQFFFSATACLGLYNGSVANWETTWTNAVLASYSPYLTSMTFPGFLLNAIR